MGLQVCRPRILHWHLSIVRYKQHYLALLTRYEYKTVLLNVYEIYLNSDRSFYVFEKSD